MPYQAQNAIRRHIPSLVGMAPSSVSTLIKVTRLADYFCEGNSEPLVLEIQIGSVAGSRDAVLAVDAGDCAQILIDSAQVMIVHLAECGPRHNLQQRSKVVRVFAGP